MNNDCFVCNPSEKSQTLSIKKYRFWTLSLHGNQCYLGRSVVSLNRHIEDLSAITSEERDELFNILKHYKKTIDSLFHPDLINYASLGNEVRHLHMHLIPRYKKPVTFEKTIFTDERWGRNYSPYNKNFTIPDILLLSIRDTIKLHL